MTFWLGGVEIQAVFPLDVTLLCLGVLAVYAGLIRRHGNLMAPRVGERAVSTRQIVLFTSGIVLFWLCDGWPLEPLSEHMFSVHMLQHMLQGFVVPPLLLLGVPEWMGDVVVRNPRARKILATLSHPLVAGLAFNLVLVGTHAPQAIALQLDSELFHAADHLVLIGTGLLMWMNIYSPVPQIRPRLQPMTQMFYLFLMTLLPTIPSAFLILGESELYPAYAAFTRPWGLGAVDDMRIGGLIMKLGVGFSLWILIAVKYFRWAAEQERNEPRRRLRSPVTSAPDSRAP